MNEFMTDKAKCAAGKPWLAIDIHRLVIGQDFLDDIEPV